MEEEVNVRIDEDYESGRYYIQIVSDDYDETGETIVKMSIREFNILELASKMFDLTQQHIGKLFETSSNETFKGKSSIILETKGADIKIINVVSDDPTDYLGIPKLTTPQGE